MCKKGILLVCLTAVLGLVGKAPADEYNWVGGTDNDNWCHEDNWSPSGGPPDGSDDQAGNGDTPPLQGPVIGPGCDANVGSITLPSGSGGQHMEITGGTLVVHGDWYWGQGDDDNGTITMSGGSVVTINGQLRWGNQPDANGTVSITDGTSFNCGSNIKIGDDGSGVLNISGSTTDVNVQDLQIRCGTVGKSKGTFTMTGGTLYARGGIWLGFNNGPDPNAIKIFFDDGYISCNGFGMETIDGNEIPFIMEFGANAVLEIRNEGIAGKMQEFVDAGFIRGKGGADPPSVVTIGGSTFVGYDLYQLEASNPSPDSPTGNLCPNSVTISWTPGMYCVDDHNVYFGTSEDDVDESTTANWQHYAANSLTLTNLEVGRSYFWRVDEVNDSCDASPWKGSVWHFSTEPGAASGPSPDRRGLKAEDVDTLSWSTHCIADTHNLYFATDLPASIVLFDDDFETGPSDPNWTASGSWVIFDANGDPNFGGRDANMAKATGSGDLITASINATNGDPCVMNISFYFRKTEDINDGEIKLYYYDGNDWDFIADLNSLPGANDVWLHYSDVNSDSQYFVSTFKIKLEANITGGTVYIDDVTVTNTWPTAAQWYKARVAGNSYPISVEPMTVYYWRVDTVIDGNVYQGPHWKFSTGFGGLLMYYRLDGTNPFPSPIQDDSDNDIEFYKYTDGGGSVTYGESNPISYGSTASANFEPNAGLYRLDPCGPSELTRDLLRLDGYQYTVEMWVMPRNLTDEEDVYLISKRDSWNLYIKTEDNYEFRWGGSGTGGDSVESDEWYHVAVIYDETDEDEELSGIYLNGDEKGNVGGGWPSDNNSPIWIGARVLADGNLGDFYDGKIDEIRIHDIALRPCELLLFQGPPEYPSCPIPYDGEGEIDPCTVELMWDPGEGAVSHDIYFSSNYSEVVGGSPVETGWGPSNWTPTTLPLRDGTVYYWRIDTYDNGGPPYEGDVWQFTTKYVITDETLLLHYKLDETAGDDAIDASGHGHHGDVDEDDKWDPSGGQFGGCLIFENDQYIDVPSEATSAIADKISISVWLYGYQQGTRDNWVLQIGDGDYSVDVIVPDDNGDVYCRAGNDSNDVLVWNDATPSAWEGDWHFFAFVKDESTDFMKIYFDGLEVKSKDEGTSSSLTNVAGRSFNIGAEVGDDDSYIGKMDDLRVFSKALSAKEVGALFRGGDIERAWGPNPYDGQPDAAFNTDLTWKAGDYAAQHKVYFGTSWQDVNSMTDPCAAKDLGDESYDPGILELDKTYFWRVDEVNDACDPNGWKGYVWRFKVAEYIIIDDMEDYTETIVHPIAKKAGASTWGWDDMYVNGTGAGVILQTIPPIHGGDQAMWYYYDNSGVNHSEISNHFTLDPCDWDALGLKMLSLWFYGLSENDANETEQMYVGLDDHDGTYAEVRYPPEDMEDIRVEEWQEWNIPLNEFTTVNLEDVNKLYIGFGDREAPALGGYGDVYFDDIRLYQPTCVPWLLQPDDDLNDDCIVDFDDVKIMAEEWLKADVNLGAVTKPDDANLLGWWTLDEGGGSDAYDYSNNNHHGAIETIDVDAWWVSGRNDVNYALDFDGGRVLVADAQELRPLNQVSVSAWIKYSATQNSGRIVVKGTDNKETYGLEVGDEDVLVFNVRDGNDPNAESFPRYDAGSDNDSLERGEWIHVSGTYDGNDVKCYINGELAGTKDASELIFLSQDTNDLAIGNRSDATDRPFVGTIDDVRVYDYGLSIEEVRYLATDSTGWVAMESIANLVTGEPLGEGAVNFRDFAELADSWLEEKLYPQ